MLTLRNFECQTVSGFFLDSGIFVFQGDKVVPCREDLTRWPIMTMYLKSQVARHNCKSCLKCYNSDCLTHFVMKFTQQNNSVVKSVFFRKSIHYTSILNALVPLSTILRLTSILLVFISSSVYLNSYPQSSYKFRHDTPQYIGEIQTEVDFRSVIFHFSLSFTVQLDK